MNKESPKSPSLPGRIIPVESYPPMLRKSLASRALFELKSDRLKQHATDILATSSAGLRAAVLKCVEQMEEARGNNDIEGIFLQAHEIRGMAATAGVGVAGVIANGLCQYLDAADQAGVAIDLALVSLHQDAIVRAVQNSEDSALGSVVARELTQLVSKKLAGVKE